MVTAVQWMRKPEWDMPGGAGFDYDKGVWVDELCWLDVESGETVWLLAGDLPEGAATQH